MFGLLQNDFEVDVNGEVEMIIVFCFILIGRFFDDIQLLVLVGEGMVVCKFKKFDIVNVVLSLIGCYFLFNVDYFKGLGG